MVSHAQRHKYDSEELKEHLVTAAVFRESSHCMKPSTSLLRFGELRSSTGCVSKGNKAGSCFQSYFPAAFWFISVLFTFSFRESFFPFTLSHFFLEGGLIYLP